MKLLCMRPDCQNPLRVTQEHLLHIGYWEFEKQLFLKEIIGMHLTVESNESDTWIWGGGEHTSQDFIRLPIELNLCDSYEA